MKKFNVVKQYKKISSSNIDEKIKFLNKELAKTGMLSEAEVTNSTSHLYCTTRYIPPVPAVPAVPPKYSNKIIGYKLFIPDGGSIYSPNAYEAPVYELIDPGTPEIPEIPGRTVVVYSNSLGDPNYYPGPIPPPDQQVAGVNYDIYNYILKTHGMGAAEWYLNNPTAPHGANPHLPSGAYVPLAMSGEVMNKLNMSQEAASTLIAQVVPSGPHTEVYYDPAMKAIVPRGVQTNPQGIGHGWDNVPLGIPVRGA